MVEGFRIDTGLCKQAKSKKDSLKTFGTRARWAKGKTGIGLDEHGATHT